MTKKLLAVLPAIFLLASCGKKTPNCASPEATSLTKKQVAQQLIKAGATGYSESKINGMISITNIQTVSANTNVDSYQCKADATVTYPPGLAEKITEVTSKNGGMLYDIPKLLAEKYGLNAVGMSTQLAAIVMRTNMQGKDVKDTFNAALLRDNKSDVAYNIFKIEKAQNNESFGVNGQLTDTDFVSKTVFYLNIAPVIEAYHAKIKAEEQAVQTSPDKPAKETTAATEEAKPAAEPAHKADGESSEKSKETVPIAETKPADAPAR